MRKLGRVHKATCEHFFFFYIVPGKKIPFSLWSLLCLVVCSPFYLMIGISRLRFWYTPAISVSKAITTITVPLIEGDWITITHNDFFKPGCICHSHHLFKLYTGPLRDISEWMAIAAAEQIFWTNPHISVAVIVAFLVENIISPHASQPQIKRQYVLSAPFLYSTKSSLLLAI